MPSEAQSQEPRDRGPPPVTRAGRSALLAKASISPASERRSRGRPRKDGRSVAPPSPPPPPVTKNKKKGRSRGRAQAEDEESVDTAEKSPAPKTDVREKVATRRRSTSRRKSQTKDGPESPAPSPEPGPTPSPQAQTPTLDPGHDPPGSPPHSPDPTSAPPSPVPMEMEEQEVCVPMDVSPAPSPCSSAPETPRLEDEDVFPLFQRCLTDESGCSPTASIGDTTKHLTQCAFCLRGALSPLGQGPLVVFGPTPGYIPLHVLNSRASPDRHGDCHDHVYRRDEAVSTCSSPEQSESSSEFVEQLGPIGLPLNMDVQSLFDPTGQCCAHLQCASWSEGVSRGEAQCLLFVDKAIDSASTQVCAFCHQLGASLRCRETGCGRSYHFPCAAAASTNQDWSQRVTWCSRHAHKLPVQCVLCSRGADVADVSGGLLMCCCCGDHYHSNCLDPPLRPSPLSRAGWQCAQCRVCRTCGLREAGSPLLVCERCDKAYHPHCLSPVLLDPPASGWSCKSCRVCRRCGVRSSGAWANHPFLCESCDPVQPCSLCGDAPDLYSPQDHVTCINCFRSVHTECIVQVGEARLGAEPYTCAICRPRAELPGPTTPHSPPAITIPTPAVLTEEAPPISPPLSHHTQSPQSSNDHSPVRQIPSESPESPDNVDSTQSHPSSPSALLLRSPTQPSELPPSPSQNVLTESQSRDSPVPLESEPSEICQPAPDSAEPSEICQPAPDCAEPSESCQPTPDSPEPLEISQPTADCAEPSEICQPTADCAEPLEICQPTPDSVEPSEICQPTADCAEPLEICQPTPDSAEPSEIGQPAPLLAETQKCPISPFQNPSLEEIDSEIELSDDHQTGSPSMQLNSVENKLDPESVNLQERLTVSESPSQSPKESRLKNEDDSTPMHPHSPQLSPQPCQVSENSEPFQAEPMEVGQNISDSNIYSSQPPHRKPAHHSQCLEQFEPVEEQQSLSPSVEMSEESPKSPVSKVQVVNLEANITRHSPIQLAEETVIAASPKSSPKVSHQEESSELDSTKLQESHTQAYLDVTDQQNVDQDSVEEMEQEMMLPVHQCPTALEQNSPSRLSPVEEEDKMEVGKLRSSLQKVSTEIQIQGNPKSQSEPQSPQSANSAEICQKSDESLPSQVEITEPQMESSPSSPLRSPSLPPTLETSLSLDRELPETEQNICTLEKDLFAAPCWSKSSSHASFHSAPCSPSPTLTTPSQCSLSQPPSPKQVDLTRPLKPLELRISDLNKIGVDRGDEGCAVSPNLLPSPNFESQTLEKLPSSPSAVDLSEMPNKELEEPPAQSSPSPASPVAPQSLSTSAKHSSLTLSPCADPTGDATPPPSPAQKLVQASPLEDTEMPASPMQSDIAIAEASSTSPEQEDMEVDVKEWQKEASPSPSSPVQIINSETPILAKPSDANHLESSLEASTSPALTPASFSPPHCKSPEVSPGGVSQSAAEIVHSPPRSSPAGLASPVSTQRRFEGSPAHATEPSSPQPVENIPLEKTEQAGATGETEATLILNQRAQSPVKPCKDEVSASEIHDAEQTNPVSPKSLPDTLEVSPISPINHINHAEASSPHLSPQRSASPIILNLTSPVQPLALCPAMPQPSSPSQDEALTPSLSPKPEVPESTSPDENVLIDEAKVTPVTSPVSSPKHEPSPSQSPQQTEITPTLSPSRSKASSFVASPAHSQISMEVSTEVCTEVGASPVCDSVKTEVNTVEVELPVCEDPLLFSRSEASQQEMEGVEPETALSAAIPVVEEHDKMEVEEQNAEEPMEMEGLTQQTESKPEEVRGLLRIEEREDWEASERREERGDKEALERREERGDERVDSLYGADGTEERVDDLLRTKRIDQEPSEMREEREEHEDLQGIEGAEEKMEEDQSEVEDNLQMTDEREEPALQRLDEEEPSVRKEEEVDGQRTEEISLEEKEEEEERTLEEEEEEQEEEEEEERETGPCKEPPEEQGEDVGPHSPLSGVQSTPASPEEHRSPAYSAPASPLHSQQALSAQKASPHSALSPPPFFSPPASAPPPSSPPPSSPPPSSPPPPSPPPLSPCPPPLPSPPRAGSLEGSLLIPSVQTENDLPTNQETTHITHDQNEEMESTNQIEEPTNQEFEPTNEKLGSQEVKLPNQNIFNENEEFKSNNEKEEFKNHSESANQEEELLKDSEMDDNSCSSMLETGQSQSLFGNVAVESAKEDQSDTLEEQEGVSRFVNEKEEEGATSEMVQRIVEKTNQSDGTELEEEFEMIQNEEVLKIQEEMLQQEKLLVWSKSSNMEEISHNVASEELKGTEPRIKDKLVENPELFEQEEIEEAWPKITKGEESKEALETIDQSEKDDLEEVNANEGTEFKMQDKKEEEEGVLIADWEEPKEKTPRNEQSGGMVLEEGQKEVEITQQQDKTVEETGEMVDQSEVVSLKGESVIGKGAVFIEMQEEIAIKENEELEEPREKAAAMVDQSEVEESVVRVELDEDKIADKLRTLERTEFSTNDEEVQSVEMCEDSQDKEEGDSELEDAVSPVLDLDPSLDMEVMALISSASPPPSLLALSSPSPTMVLPRRGKGRSVLRSLQSGCRAEDDLTVRLRQSPFSTEASPENSPTRLALTPPPLSPLTASPSNRESPPLSRPQIPPTVIPFTPKIGMGKPAITKRKFSPGRARARQCSWWSSRRAVSPPSSSQDSNDGWDSPKPRSQDSPLWGMKTGRGSGFPGRRRSRGGGIGSRGGRGRSRLKTQDSLSVSPGGGYMESFQMRDEEENSMHNTVVMFSTSDHFTLKQDMCVVCGSFGQGEEGRLLACAQCGQCYHPYCVNVKITRVILTKGWRCLECTVCEACGEASDPGRLLLCDDCDISYHTYCLDPPLHNVPKGAWKCKWCVWCVQCGSTSPGLHCDWMNNYSLCGPCSSLSRCPLCQRTYSQDELILQCQQCDRWVHAVCHGLMSEEEVESTADEGFDCSLCKNHGRGTYARSDSFDSPYMAQIISRFREPELKTYTQDGVCLTELGLSHLQSLVEPLTSPRRYRRNKPKLKLRIINQNSVSVLQTPEPETPTEQEPPRDLDCEMKSDSSPEREPHHEEYGPKETETTEGKKRKRKPYRPGIGGFMVRQRGGKGPSRIKLCRSDSTDTYPGRDDDGDAMDTSADHSMEKVKKRYRKKRTKLEETFPSYLQEAFFGRDLLDRSRLIDRRVGQEAPCLSQSGPTLASGPMKGPVPVPHGHAPQKHGPLPISEEALVDLSDVLNTDPHILATGQTGQFQGERSPSPFAGLDIGPMDSGRAQRSVQEEPLDAILSPELDKMVSDGAILSKLYKIPELEGKDVEDLFTAVLSPNRNSQSESQASSKPHPPAPGGQFPRLPLVNGLMGSSSHFPGSPMIPLGQQATPRFRVAPPPHSGSAPSLPGPTHSLQPSNQAQSPADDQDVLSTAQRGMLKWEKEEPLGEQATVAPVLYCNIKFPQLKEQYPDWPSRMKQIAKLWRKASSQDRAPFVQKARDNRAAQRINKVQLPPDPLKRLAPPPPQMTYDPISMETDTMFKDPLRPKETEQEQEWKMRQGEVNERWGSGLKSPSHKDCPFQASVAGAGQEPLQMRQKSKQLAKMEATQKLEQVKNEQLLQQRQQQILTSQRLCGGVSPDTGSRSPMASNQHSAGSGGTSGLVDDVFLRPQAPPLSGFSPSSPQMFSPPSSRPSSPWDPYSKVVGTPRPPSAPQPPLQARRNSLSASPAHDALGSPAPSPDAKGAEMFRSMAPQQALQQTRPGMLSPSGLEHSRLSYQRPVFKAPMPPHQQDFSGARRDPTRPTDLGFPLNQDFPSSPLSGLGSPHRSPYSQAPGTPRPDYTQQAGEALSHHSPLTSRPSPDPYSNPQTPGTPRFPRSPVGTPRPSPEAYTQGTDTFSGQGPAASGSSPRAPGLSAEAAGFPPHHQRSPGRPQPQQHTPKHAGISEEGQTPGHDPFEQSHITTGPQNDKLLSSNELSALGADGPMSMMPQMGDSEDKLRQVTEMRQRLRQLILRQQQQKSALRQEKGLQEAGPGHTAAATPGQTVTPAPAHTPAQAPTTPGHLPQTPPAPGLTPSAPNPAPSVRHWSQEEPDPFGRPPPPYPGQMRPVAPPTLRLHPEQQLRGFTPGEAGAFPRQMLIRAPPLRFAVPPVAPGLQDSFMRPAQGPVPGPGLSAPEGVPVPIRRPLPSDFTGIRPLSGPTAHPHMMQGLALVTGVPQPPFLPRSVPVQPHPSHSIMGQPYIELRHRAPEHRLRLPFPVPEQEVPPPRQQQPLAMAANVELAGGESMEEHLEGEDSAVKDLEDVEVKDLVDLNLNLDPEDGKEDLDLAANDLHLDDFLLSGKFDLIAYADPELNLDNADLDLDPMDQDRDRKSGEHSGQSAASNQIKQEVKPEGREAGSVPQNQASHSGHIAPVRLPAPGASSLKTEGPPTQSQAPPASMATAPQRVFQQRALGPSSLAPPQSLHPRVVLNPQIQSQNQGPVQSSAQSEGQGDPQDPSKARPLLLEEQPLLLQDLLDQERQEQQQQKQMQALIRQKASTEQPFPNMDFDSISDPIMKAKMVALKGINKFMSQGPLGLNPMVRLQQQPAVPSTAQEGAPPTPLPGSQDGVLNPPMVRPTPPNFGPGFVNEGQRRQYEEWLGETQRLLQMQQRLLEDQIATHRKTKKALSAKQRTAKRAGRPFAEEDAAQLRYVTEQQGAVQKQLEQIRKQQKDHSELIEDYRSKLQPRSLQPPPGAPLMPTTPSPGPLVPPGAPVGPGLMQHPPCVPGLGPGTPGWAPTQGMGPGVMPQRMPPHIPPQMGPQPPAQRPGFNTGSNGSADAPTPHVKFDDNNPFSEGFQERERRERLREQQERQRVQLMHEVERHRALQQRMELEQQGMLGPGPRPPLLSSNPPSDGLSQMPFFSSELPSDFLQSPPSRPPAPHQQTSHHPGFPGAQLHHQMELQSRARPPGPGGTPAQPQCGPGGMPPSLPGAQRFGHDSSSSSPSTPRGPAPMHQLYSDILPDDKPKSRKKGEGGDRTPLSSHSDDITAPPTPAHSDTACSTPTRPGADQSELSLAPSSELERQLSVTAAAEERGSILGRDSHRGPLSAGTRLEVKEERVEGGACSGGVKMEDSEAGDSGKELLRHLLKEKSPSATPPPSTPHGGAVRQMSVDSARSEEEEGYPNNSGRLDSPGGDLDKKARFKRLNRPEKEKSQTKYKRRKRDDEDVIHSNSTGTDPIITHLRQLSVLPLMEPVLRVDLSLFPPYGSSSLGSDSRLSGSFGNACLDGVTDYYSQLIYKQNNLSNPPTPPASLPPTPPPVARQKLVNGFATTEELSRKELSEQEVKAVKQKGEELLTLTHASKTVDVPASLPTPPHNNQEEIRVQFLSESLSPEEYVPSSSPESVADAEISRYPDLSFIKLEPPSPCPSPTVPIMPCAWGKGSALKQEVKSEPNLQAPPSCSNTDLVTISVTLNPLAAQNVPGVMAAMAQLLRLPVPLDYQLHRTGPERSNLALLAGVRVPMMQGPPGIRPHRPPAPANSVRMELHPQPPPRPQSCGFCKVPLGNGVRVVKQEGQSRPQGGALVFCSSSCSAQYAAHPQTNAANKLASPPSKTQHRYTNNMSSIAVHTLPLRPPSSGSAPSPPLAFPPASAITMETRRTDSLKVKVKLKPRPRAVPGGEEPRHGKRSKTSRWRRWSLSITLSRGPCVPPEPLSEEDIQTLGACLRGDPTPKDLRRCCFCQQHGDGVTDGPARLLNLDLDLWVHLNCALWSSEVYETQAGALINVELALRRGLTLRCAHCQQTGATSGCNRLRCTNTYHFTCAIQAQCTFFKDKTMLCHLHKPRSLALSPSSSPYDPALTSDPYDSELRCFAVFRRVYVQRDEARQIAAVVQRGERQHTFRVGSLLFRAVGRLLPSQLHAFHSNSAIYPVGYHANRLYWSMRHRHRRCKYMCYIEEKDAQPLFKIKVVEKGHEDLVLTGSSPKAVWEQVLEPIAQMRASSASLKLFPVYLKGEELFGLTTSAVTRIIESLPGVEACEQYTFRFGKNPLMEWPLAFNPTGSARSEPKASQAKRPTFLTSVAPRCQGSVGSIVGLVPGVLSLSPGESVSSGHQGRHSKSAQYRRMKAEWKSNVYLARSRIQGLGLYAARDIEKCTMVIEYIGTIIRSEVANRKERLYESQNRGVYMFRIDNDFVIDATITGGPARYINHSCSPNCITEVVSIEKENKIIISSCRRIQRGEELCYDYKFDFEDDQHKIPCHCGAVNCRKWMN
ncbi:histone-lysine N-methyltransferase 2C-like isoform X4 [Periophthalmus magnuspinnatus]|uniref:histone-lysine N-methyltransferase 2C-like isoform X4 n=1 Tax=Periophthalmus magnuspinnatus TaxID=409849 RepID=UPI002436939C|nr:histone-lysine N-methyltransferase 2C-like isoform X4 [Periophthalmus magnuspinnatus]